LFEGVKRYLHSRKKQGGKNGKYEKNGSSAFCRIRPEIAGTLAM